MKIKQTDYEKRMTAEQWLAFITQVYKYPSWLFDNKLSMASMIVCRSKQGDMYIVKKGNTFISLEES